jgi:hypothetical protein
MSSRFADFLKIPAGIVEMGLTALDAGASTMRAGIDALAGPKTPRLRAHAPPVHGPQDLDTALADFANQMVRIGWITLPEGMPIKQLAGDLMSSGTSVRRNRNCRRDLIAHDGLLFGGRAEATACVRQRRGGDLC